MGLYAADGQTVDGGAACKSESAIPLFAAQPTKVFCRGFLKKREAGACKIRVQPHGVCHGFCLGQAERPSRILAACGPRFYEGCGPGEGRCPRKKARPAWGLAFFLTRRLLKKAGENF